MEGHRGDGKAGEQLKYENCGDRKYEERIAVGV
jgi:hypothetical protein